MIKIQKIKQKDIKVQKNYMHRDIEYKIELKYIKQLEMAKQKIVFVTIEFEMYRIGGEKKLLDYPQNLPIPRKGEFVIVDGLVEAGSKAPLFHCRFLPTFTQVNFFPETIDVCPALEQVEPALTAEKLDSAVRIENVETKQIATANLFLG